MTGHAGDRVILQCQVDSNPAPEYRWMKNGDVFEVRERERIVIKNVTDDELMIVILDGGHGTSAQFQSDTSH